jgi:hypothetical protein
LSYIKDYQLIRKVAVIGKGTVGCLSALKFSNEGYEVDWYHDPKTPALSVGEGTDLVLPAFLDLETDLNYDKLKQLDAHYKQGIEKINWGKEPFTHWFGLGKMGLHINAHKLQNYIADYLGDKVNVINKKVEHNEIEDYIIDCSGKPPITDDYNFTPIPVNSAYVVNCPWDKPTLSKTICIAKSYGWVFLIPLQNRCSVGYLYNKNYGTGAEVKDELGDILKEYNLQADSGNYMFFENYYRKQNFNKKVSYNGNASFFLEPLEATSLNVSIRMVNQCLTLLTNGDLRKQNNRYKAILEETIDIIMLHYLVDPPIKNLFWEYANHKAEEWFSNRYKTYPKIRLITKNSPLHYSTWFDGSFKQNLTGLGLYDKLNKFKYD